MLEISSLLTSPKDKDDDGCNFVMCRRSVSALIKDFGHKEHL